MILYFIIEDLKILFTEKLSQTPTTWEEIKMLAQNNDLYKSAAKYN